MLLWLAHLQARVSIVSKKYPGHAYIRLKLPWYRSLSLHFIIFLSALIL